MRQWLVMMVLAGVAALGSGCAFHRTVANAHFKDIDPSFITVGKTTVYDVLDRLGPPAPVSELSENFRLISDTHLCYVCYESRRTTFALGYVLFLPFCWEDGQMTDELLIEFDRDSGVVSSVTRTRQATVRPPLQGESARAPRQTQDLTPGLRR